MAKLIQLPGARPVNEGEALVIQYLNEALPDSYSLIPNVEIAEKGRPPFDYDLIVVAPHAVYVVEIKRWLGGIHGDDYTWWVAGQYQRPNPLPTTNNKCRVLKSQIERRQPAVTLWVEPIVAIADDQAQLNLRGWCRQRVFRYTDLPDFLTDSKVLGSKAHDLRTPRAYIEKAIQEVVQGRRAGELRFGDYKVLETLSRRDHVAEYLARNELLRGGAPVRLRVFSYDPYLPEADLARQREIIRREAEALQKIGPHLNLITLQGFTTDPNDPNLLVEVTDWSDTGTLRTLLSSDSLPTLERKLELAEGIAAGLKIIHEAEVIHRDIRPENILIGPDGQPRLMNFDRARLTLPGIQTISPIKPDPDVPRAYMAPELLNPTHTPTPAADLYSLGVILFEMLVEQKPLFETPEEALENDTLLGGPAAFATDIPEQLNELVRRLARVKPAERPQSAAEVLVELRAIRSRPSGTVPDPVPEAEPEPAPQTAQEIEPARFDVGHIIDGKYQVQQVLEKGFSGQVYKVYDDIFDRVYALKVLNDTSLSLQLLKKEARSLLEIEHPNIVRVQNWGRLAQSGRFYLVSEFVDGEELTKYAGSEQRLPVREAIEAVLDLLAALEAIHPDVERLEALREKMYEGEISEEEYEEIGRLQEEGWLHRDIKPANLMLTKTGLKLIDFNIAAKASEANRTLVGTPGYMLPDVGIMPWSTAGDLFAAGVVLYELITGYHPYPNREPNPETGPIDPRTYRPELRPELAELIMQAVSCLAEQRYRSAHRLRQDILNFNGIYLQAGELRPTDIGLELASWEQGKPNYNPYVTRFLKLYSQARRDNSGTRGLDKIARLTYVETRLDRLLRPAVLNGQYRLVIITGNAGDGKTAFIQNLEATVDQAGGYIERPKPNANSSRFTYQRAQFTTNYDGSQDEEGRANDQVLSEFFAPFTDARLNQVSTERAVHIIAINEGRLLDFFDATSAAATQFQQLRQIIHNFFNPDLARSNLPEWLLIVDLNQRSVVAPDREAKLPSIFDRQLQALLKPEFWASCQVCALKEHCFIKFNVDTLADPASGPAIRERLRTLFEIVHLRRQQHITMRDLRSALSWLLFRDHTCDDVAQMVGSQPSTELWAHYLYYNAYAADGQIPTGRSDDRLVKLLRQIDPAQVANPTTDRTLHFQGLAGLQMLTFENRSTLLTNLLDNWQLPGGWQAGREAQAAIQHRTNHLVLRRIAYFERRDDVWLTMLPYQNLSRFREVTQTATIAPDDRAALRELLVHGISLAEEARNDKLAQEFVCLRAGQQAKAAIKSFRLFPKADFKLNVPQAQGRDYLEYTPDRIVLFHDPQDPAQRIEGARPAELNVSLDLLELLAQIREGFTPSPDDINGIFINLIIFRNALAHLPYRHVLLTRDDATFYQLLLEENAIIRLSRWSPEGVLDEFESQRLRI